MIQIVSIISLYERVDMDYFILLYFIYMCITYHLKIQCEKVSGMIDIHCHILPFLDDGARDWDEAMRMAMVAVDNGIHTIIATPHHGNGRYTNDPKRIRLQVDLLNEKLKARNIPLQIYPGQEYHLGPQYRQDFEQYNIQTLAGSSCLLVELPARRIPDYFPAFMQYVHQQGLRLIIAHPERNPALMKNLSLLSRWVANGVQTQITAQSLLGLFGTQFQHDAFELCRRGMAHILASDAHNTITRSFYLRESYHYLGIRLGKEIVEAFLRNASNLVGIEQAVKVGDKEWKQN